MMALVFGPRLIGFFADREPEKPQPPQQVVPELREEFIEEVDRDEEVDERQEVENEIEVVEP